MRGQSAASDADSDIERERAATGGSPVPPTPDAHLAYPGQAPDHALDNAPLPPVADLDADAHPKPRSVPKVTSDSFISELLADRAEAGGPPAAGQPLPGEDGKPGQPSPASSSSSLAPALPSSQSRGPLWSNVDLEETQSQPDPVAEGAPGGPASLDACADTCSLSSVVTYSLALEEEPYGEDGPPMWAWVSGGGCAVDSHSQLNWFSCPGATGGGLNSIVCLLSLLSLLSLCCLRVRLCVSVYLTWREGP